MDYYPVAFFLIFILALVIYFSVQTKKETTGIELVGSKGSRLSLDVELADNSAKRAKGLMFWNSLGENKGMLFIFDNEDFRRFWMMNTSIPLDAIHMDANGTVVDIIRMVPCGILDCKAYVPKAKAKYVLEVNAGFADKYGIEIGKSRGEGLPG